jgi:alcohol dehydrogenase, propanol-preferring
MRALRLSAPAAAGSHPLELVELPDPEPGPDELLLRVAACAVCRTDLQIVEGDLTARRLPIVPGHQAVGVVERVGRDATGWTEGDRAGVGWLAAACGRCSFCRGGRENLCRDATFSGWDRDGGFATRLSVRAEFALRLPDGFDDLAAAPLLCGGVIGYRALKVSGIEPGGRLGLYGFGASAHLALQVARLWDCEVHVRTRSPRGREQAASLGAASVGSYDEVVVAALRDLDRGGTVAVNAIHLDRIPGFSYDLLWSERGIRSVANYTRADAQEFLGLAASAGMKTSVQTFPLESANEAVAGLAAGELEGTAVLVSA